VTVPRVHHLKLNPSEVTLLRKGSTFVYITIALSLQRESELERERAERERASALGFRNLPK